jgi:N-acetyl-gamma-glutamyl-phosphate reductase
MKKFKAGIINVTGYAGADLARLLYAHPEVSLTSVTGRSSVGQKLGDVFPHLADIKLTIEAELGEVDVVFSAMPHKASAEAILAIKDKCPKIIDISADFRLKKADEYPLWYDFQHPAPQLLSGAVYGLPELYKTEIAKAAIVANPGCYPTGALLALAPLAKEGLIKPDIIIDSKSGVSGAGRTLTMSTHFAEATDNVTAYALDGHRHLPEIVQELQFMKSGWTPKVTFLPHLIPMSRGILSSCYAWTEEKAWKKDLSSSYLRDLYQEFYAEAPFMRIVEKPPGTKHTWGSNFCFVYPVVDKRTGRIIVISSLDNLVKGAAGQAIQNMNIMMGFSETSGLESLPLYP